MTATYSVLTLRLVIRELFILYSVSAQNIECFENLCVARLDWLGFQFLYAGLEFVRRSLHHQYGTDSKYCLLLRALKKKRSTQHKVYSGEVEV